MTALQLWKDVLTMKEFQGWRRALAWAVRTLWSDLRWGVK